MNLTLKKLLRNRATTTLVILGIINFVMMAILLSANALGMFEGILHLTNGQWSFILISGVVFEFVLMEVFTFLKNIKSKYEIIDYDAVLAIKLESIGKVSTIAIPLAIVTLFVNAFLEQIYTTFIVVGVTILGIAGLFGFLFLNKIMLEKK